jgi:hypothetical protein
MKLQGASVLDLVAELLIRLDAMGKAEQLANLPLGAILEGCGHEPIEVFSRMLGDRGMKVLSTGRLAPKAKG